MKAAVPLAAHDETAGPRHTSSPQPDVGVPACMNFERAVFGRVPERPDPSCSVLHTGSPLEIFRSSPRRAAAPRPACAAATSRPPRPGPAAPDVRSAIVQPSGGYRPPRGCPAQAFRRCGQLQAHRQRPLIGSKASRGAPSKTGSKSSGGHPRSVWLLCAPCRFCCLPAPQRKGTQVRRRG
jgi:hypothetical protein